jgi:glycopeptide antibiotics resistance protein
MPSDPAARLARLRTPLKLLAWILLAGIAFSTLAPIGLRPESGWSPNAERAFAYALAGFVFALAYPRRLVLVVAIIALSALGFEFLQLVVASRHARLADAGFKLLGGGIGVAVGVVVTSRLRSAWPLTWTKVGAPAHSTDDYKTKASTK